MKLSKDQRKELHAGEALTLERPASDKPPYKTGKAYAIGGDSKCLVLRQRNEKSHWSVVVVLDTATKVRLLPRGVGDYTESPFQAMSRGDGQGAELEAVDEETQKRLTIEAHQRFRHERPELLARREDKDRLARIKDLQDKARGAGMTHIGEALDRVVENLRDEMRDDG